MLHQIKLAQVHNFASAHLLDRAVHHLTRPLHIITLERQEPCVLHRQECDSPRVLLLKESFECLVEQILNFFIVRHPHLKRNELECCFQTAWRDVLQQSFVDFT